MTLTDLSAVLAEPFPWARPPIDPPAQYRQLQENQPIVRVLSHEGEPVWLVTRYDDVRQILADPRSSSDMSKPGFPLLGAPPLAPEQRMFLRMDPPDHTIFRRLLAKHFLVKNIEALRPRIVELVDAHLDALLAAPDRRGDLVSGLALPVPSTVLTWVLGVPLEDREFFNHQSEESLKYGDPTSPTSGETSMAATGALYGYLAELAGKKDALDDPGEDILGSLVSAARRGEITMQDVVNSGFVLIVAGHDTTASMTALGTLTLLQHRDQWEQLRADPTLIPGAVEELLRYLTIVHLIVVRVAAEDIEIGDVTIPAGEGIVPLNLAANRDDAHFSAADTFDIHRSARDHFAFGYGVHQCIGQNLARIELQVIFERLLARAPDLRLDAEIADLSFKLWSPINGLFRLPVMW